MRGQKVRQLFLERCLRTFGERNWWLTGVVAGLYFLLNKFHLLASLNLLEKMHLPHEDHSSDGGANALDWLNSASRYVVCCRTLDVCTRCSSDL